MTAPDVLYVAFIAILLSLDHFALWPTFLRRSQADPGGARVWIWSSWMSVLWVLVATGFGLWLFEQRSWASLGLTLPRGWRLWGAIGLVVAVAVTYARTIVKRARIARTKRVRLDGQSAKLAVVLPHTGAELRWFVALSLSAGFCEEFVFRGYVIWVFHPLLGLWGAAALSVVAFALAHAYQGARGVSSAGVAGALLTLIVLMLGSLWPAILVHALVDIGQGTATWLVVRRMDADASTRPRRRSARSPHR